jgi:hypothetical protein
MFFAGLQRKLVELYMKIWQLSTISKGRILILYGGRKKICLQIWETALAPPVA